MEPLLWLVVGMNMFITPLNFVCYRKQKLPLFNFSISTQNTWSKIFKYQVSNPKYTNDWSIQRQAENSFKPIHGVKKKEEQNTSKAIHLSREQPATGAKDSWWIKDWNRRRFLEALTPATR